MVHDIFLSGRLFGLGTALENFEDEMEFLPQPVWTPLGKQKAAVNSPLANIWSSETAFSNFSSSISCIKKFGHNFHDAASTNSSVQRALYPQIVASIMHITLVIITCVSTCAFYVLYYCLVIEHELGLLDIINMVATLGSGGSGGSVYIMDMSTIDSATVSRNAHERIERVASFDRTVWTADCNSDGTQVVLGELADWTSV